MSEHVDPILAQHHAVWSAIGELAAQCGRSTSGFAVACGLDLTSFNPSKRFNQRGEPRFPGGATLALVLTATATATATGWAEFGAYVDATAKLYVSRQT